ncbi:MAG: Isocitrate dehydrogenase kinase/phosphatase [Glaciecola sp. HTCC2999]|jgi:isocitrate dehydrogenase kinase/phosphatase|nr:MAG: Isocitrate dehydrogenase kinase/phosphatase [Glaciecola sp. HTCC2999]
MDRAKKIAYLIMGGFDKNYRKYTRITRGAQERFEKRLWNECQQSIRERINDYDQSVSDVVAELFDVMTPSQEPLELWVEMKLAYTKLLATHPQFELAETFYNSIICRIFKHGQIDDTMMYVNSTRCFLPGQDRLKVVNAFDTTGTVRNMFEEIFTVYRFNTAFAELPRDLGNLDTGLRKILSPEQLSSVHTVEMLKSVFYRGKAAYLIGRICMPDETIPFVIALRINRFHQIFVDALLTDRKDLSVIFGFARSYFMADSQYPAEVVAFLQELLPNKKQFELYMSLGFYKHGKTEFYRNYKAHVERTDDLFALAPGIKGLVMTVFHLPSYGVVFKVIKDEFAESKKITREHVKDRYRLVKTSDRVGRMADTHEYVNFTFPLDRFDSELLTYLKETCAGSIEINENNLIIKHLYIERRMTPLNLYLRDETDEEKIRHAIDELGLCIKQIALTNIFPGDMLHKNFGITKHGRVIFYDYDEICFMDERNFREIPKSDDPYALDTLSVAPNDVFPEQFEHFIVGKKHLKDCLKELHGDLMTPAYWRQLQAVCKEGKTINFTPYNPRKSFFYEPGKKKIAYL